MDRPSEFDAVYFDSSVFLRVVKEEGGFEVVADLIKLAQGGRLRIWTATCTLVEVRGNRRVEEMDPEREARLRQILTHSSLRFVELDQIAALEARRIGIALRMPTWDAVHLASAIFSPAPVLMTCDKRDFPIGRETEGVWVDEPYLPGQEDIFSASLTDHDSG